ncbi:hypothetical protein PQX77_009317 [Marasmius sp. AFHP31]|nr:hypothetical protein PQX77_009317 [Marasmius sp. AFHP31]
MPSINKSISIALLVGAASNVLAAPYKEPISVVESNPCIVKLTGFTASICGVAKTMMENNNPLEGCSKEQIRKCAAIETPTDKEHAEKYCPEIKNCPPHMVGKVYKDCLMKDEGMSQGMVRGTITIPGASGIVSIVGLDGKGKDGKGDEGKDGKGKDGKDDKGKDGKDDKGKDGKDTNVGVGVNVNVNDDGKKGSKDSKGADVIAVVGSGNENENDKGCPCASNTSLITANAKAEANGSH